MTNKNNYDDFEQKLREAICNAALALHESDLAFAVFANSKCNEQYWNRTSNGGWRTSEGADAVRDIYENGWKYATECATAMMIIYYKSVLDVYGDELFKKTFKSIYLMDWDIRNPLLSKVGHMEAVGQEGMIAGDRGYFDNPDHDPQLPQWQGENVIVLDDGMYYGHGIGYANADYIINSLNSRRKSGSSRSAYLMKQAGRPDFKKLADAMYSDGSVAVWHEFPPAVAVQRRESEHSTFRKLPSQVIFV